MEHLLIRVVVEIVSWIAHLFQGKDEQREEERAGLPPRPVGLPPEYPQESAAMSDANDFMRRMAQLQQPQARPPIPPQVAAPPPRRLVGGNEPIDVEILDEPPTGRGVAQHVNQAINTRGIQEHASQLAQGVRSSDEQMEARLHQKFDHKLGHLRGGVEDYQVANCNLDTGPAGSVPEGAAASAEEVAAMLRDPQSIRRAIILSEIMKPAFERE